MALPVLRRAFMEVSGFSVQDSVFLFFFPDTRHLKPAEQVLWILILYLK